MTTPPPPMDELLAHLRHKHQAIQPPAGLQERLRAATAARRPAHRLPLWAAALAAAAALALFLFRPQPAAPNPVPTPPPTQVARLTTPSPAPMPPIRPRTAPPRPRTERFTAFISLPISEGLPPTAASSILRVEIRRDDLRQYGLDIPPLLAADRIRAEFVVGEDGLARAVRFVQ